MQSPASPSWHIGYGSADEGSADAAAPPADAERRLSFLQRLAAVAAGGGAGIGLSPTNSGSSISEGQQEGTAAAPEKFYVRTRSSVSWLGVGEGGQRRGCVRATTVRILKGPLLQEPGTCTNPSCRKYVCPWAPMYKNNTICAACNQVRVKEEAAAKAAKAVKAGQPPPAKRQKQGWGGHRRGTAKKKAGAPRGWNAATVRAGCHAADRPLPPLRKPAPMRISPPPLPTPSPPPTQALLAAPHPSQWLVARLMLVTLALHLRGVPVGWAGQPGQYHTLMGELAAFLEGLKSVKREEALNGEQRCQKCKLSLDIAGYLVRPGRRPADCFAGLTACNSNFQSAPSKCRCGPILKTCTATRVGPTPQSWSAWGATAPASWWCASLT